MVADAGKNDHEEEGYHQDCQGAKPRPRSWTISKYECSQRGQKQELGKKFAKDEPLNREESCEEKFEAEIENEEENDEVMALPEEQA
ncbi:MAG: hypothetical protein ACE5HD_12920 [Acidobacteriota bacterium]